MCNEYGAQYPDRRPSQQLLRAHYLEHSWLLVEAARSYAELAEKGGLPRRDLVEARRRAEELVAWRSPVVEPVPKFEEWFVWDRRRFSIDSGALEISDEQREWQTLLSPLLWQGGRFTLDFELLIEELGYSRAILIGLKRGVDPRDRNTLFYAEALSTSGNPAGTNVMWSNEEEGTFSDGWGSEKGEDLPSGEWLSVRLVCDGSRAGLVIRNKDGSYFKVREIHGMPAAPPGPYPLAIQLSCSEEPNPMRVKIRNMVMTYPKQGPRPFVRRSFPPAGAEKLSAD